MSKKKNMREIWNELSNGREPQNDFEQRLSESIDRLGALHKSTMDFFWKHKDRFKKQYAEQVENFRHTAKQRGYHLPVSSDEFYEIFVLEIIGDDNIEDLSRSIKREDWIGFSFIIERKMEELEWIKGTEKLIEEFAKEFVSRPNSTRSELEIVSYLKIWSREDGYGKRARAKKEAIKACPSLYGIKDGTLSNWEEEWENFKTKRTK
jgi:hypothetical protein